MSHPPDDRLSAHHDGELTPAEAAEIERLLGEDSDAGRTARQHRHDWAVLSELLADLPTESLPAGTAAVIEASLTESHPAKPQSATTGTPSPNPTRHRWVVVASSIVSVAALVLVAVVLTGPNGEPQQTANRDSVKSESESYALSDQRSEDQAEEIFESSEEFSSPTIRRGGPLDFDEEWLDEAVAVLEPPANFEREREQLARARRLGPRTPAMSDPAGEESAPLELTPQEAESEESPDTIEPRDDRDKAGSSQPLKMHRKTAGMEIRSAPEPGALANPPRSSDGAVAPDFAPASVSDAAGSLNPVADAPPISAGPVPTRADSDNPTTETVKAEGMTFSSNRLKSAAIGEQILARIESEGKVRVVRLTVVDRQRGLASLQLLLMKHRIETDPLLQIDSVGLPVASLTETEDADGGETLKDDADQFVAVLVRADRRKVSAALADLNGELLRSDKPTAADRTLGRRGPIVAATTEPPIEVARLDLKSRSRMGFRNQPSERPITPAADPRNAKGKSSPGSDEATEAVESESPQTTPGMPFVGRSVDAQSRQYAMTVPRSKLAKQSAVDLKSAEAKKSKGVSLPKPNGDDEPVTFLFVLVPANDS